MSGRRRAAAPSGIVAVGRAVVAFLVLPGTIAYAIPVLFDRTTEPTPVLRWAGAALVTLGTVLLLWCVRTFFVEGRGTLAPWWPPADLVTGGPYALSRNPMYMAVLVVVTGWSAVFAARAILIYTVVLAFLFHLRVILFEEPWQRRTFGDRWERYRERVPRWIGRR